MDKPMEHVQKLPTIEYFQNNTLVVDRAWVESKENRLFVELEGCFFTISLDRARMGDGRPLDEGDLIPAGRSAPMEGAWPLTGACNRFGICLREEVARFEEHFKRQRLLAFYDI